MTALHLFGCSFNQPALPALAAFVYPKPGRNSLGYMGEVTVQRRLESYDYYVRPGRHLEGDLYAINHRSGETFRVEVKTAMQSVDRKWRFTLWVKGHTDYRDSEVVILLAVLADFTYVPFTIRVADLGQRSQLCISSHPASYAGWLSAYRLPPDADLLSPLETPLSEAELVRPVHQNV